MPAHKIGLAQGRQYPRGKCCAKLKFVARMKVYWKPPLRQAASPLSESEQTSAKNAKTLILK